MGMVSSMFGKRDETTATVQKLAGRGIPLKYALEAYQLAVKKNVVKKSCSTADFWQKVLKPLTSERKVSYTEYLNKTYNVPFQPAEIHVVHSWSMKHLDTLLAMAQFVNEKNRGPRPDALKDLLKVEWHEKHCRKNLDMSLFVCTYVVNQYSVGSMNAIHGTPQCEIDKFPLIAQEIHTKFGNPIVVATDEDYTTVSRSMCLQEIHCAIKNKIPLKFRGATCLGFTTEIDAQNAKAYDKVMEKQILDEIHDLEEGVQGFNELLTLNFVEMATENCRVMQAEMGANARNIKEMYLFIGNPGSGKSTILNGLIGSTIFESGRSFGCGLTTALQTEVVDGEIFMDTPGLDDTDMKQKAAEEITKALQKDGNYHIFFVVKLDDGRVRPADTATMQLVLESAPIKEYGVIINNVEEDVVEELKDDESGAMENVRTRLNAGLVPPSDHFYVIGRDRKLAGKNNVLWDDMPADLKEFIKDAFYSSGEIRSEIVDDIEIDGLGQRLKESEARLKELTTSNESLEKEVQRQQDELHRSKAYKKKLREGMKAFFSR